MTIFADASALIAIIAREPDAVTLAETLERDPARLCSAVAAWETTAGLCRSYRYTGEAARAIVGALFEAFRIRLIGIGEPEYAVALDAWQRFGRGRHPAALNLGDCFAYACARTHSAGLLYKGGDFGLTDIEPAGAV